MAGKRPCCPVPYLYPHGKCRPATSYSLGAAIPRTCLVVMLFRDAHACTLLDRRRSVRSERVARCGRLSGYRWSRPFTSGFEPL